MQRTADSRPGLLAAAITGGLVGAVAIAVSELIAGALGAPSLVVGIGALVISLQPPGAKDVMVNLFGANDKLVLNVLVVAVAILISIGAGTLASRRFRYGALVFIAFGVIAAAVTGSMPLASPIASTLNAAVAVATALVVLRWLLAEARPAASPAPARSVGWPRRRFLIASAGTLGAAVVAGGLGRRMLDARHIEGVVTSSKLPAAFMPAPPLAAGQDLAISGVTPLVVPNADFYRIDTALLVPQVDAESWQLRVRGMVDHELEFSYDDLLAMPLYEQYVTISCVSNRVGGHLVGNALWTGVRLKDVLEAAGVHADATQIIGRSVDGFTAGFPTAWAMDPEREAMIAVGMNREPLPAAHGFPARLIVPGLYGYVSATKWLAEIELTRREDVDGYWVPLGWAKDGPILTQSRIDTPADGDSVTAGPVEIAGVAWAPDRGISVVEVQIDDGPWQRARVPEPISPATWVQWVLAATVGPGSHLVEVRATDGRSQLQTAEVTDPAPDGARGHHRVSFSAG